MNKSGFNAGVLVGVVFATLIWGSVALKERHDTKEAWDCAVQVRDYWKGELDAQNQAFQKIAIAHGCARTNEQGNFTWNEKPLDVSTNSN